MDRKLFHLGDILSVITLYNLAPLGFGKVVELLTFMSNGDSLHELQWGRVAQECRIHLMEQVGILESDVDMEQVVFMYGEEGLIEWLADMVEQFGEFHHLHPLHFEDHTHIEPMEEIAPQVPEDMNIFVFGELVDEIDPIGRITWKSTPDEEE
jgi:hypothetical protein